jgi:hypothetical protein
MKKNSERLLVHRSRCMPLVALSVAVLAACNGGTQGTDPHLSTHRQNVNLSSVPVKDGYLAVELANDSHIVEDSAVYFTVTAKTFNPANTEDGDPCLMRVASDGTANCDVVRQNTQTGSYAYSLSTLPKSPSGKRVVYLPKSISGRIYISLGQPVSLFIAPVKDKKSGKIIYRLGEPDGFKIRDSNYYILYDKFEYTYTNDGLWANPTAVDFFSLPISLSHSQSPVFSQVGLHMARSEILNRIRQIFMQADKTTPDVWTTKLFVTDSTTGQNVLRVVSPGKAIVEDENSAVNPGHYFPRNYLMGFEGYNYTDSLWNWYRDGNGNSISVDLSELPAYAQSPIFKGKTVGTQFVFINDLGMKVVLDKPTSSASWFGGSGGTFNAENKTPQAVIIRQLTAAFDVGVLPQQGDTLLKFVDPGTGKKLFPGGAYYRDNAQWPINTGPWYDLYSKALHSLDADGTQPIYTFAYDDALGQDGTIHVDRDKVQADSLKVTLNDMVGTTVPSFDPVGKIYTNVSLDVGGGPKGDEAQGNVVNYQGSDGQWRTLTGPGGASGLSIKIPLLASFCDETGTVQTASLYINPAMIRPYVQGSDGIAIDNHDLNQVKIKFPGMNKDSNGQSISCNNPLRSLDQAGSKATRMR